MNMSSKLFSKLKNSKKYRELFIAGQINTGIPFQVRALRSARRWTQDKLGEESKMPQTVISRIESRSAGSLSIKTLLKIAAAFDVALVVRFVPFSEMIDWAENLSPEAVAPKSFEEEAEEAKKAISDAFTSNRTISTTHTFSALFGSSDKSAASTLSIKDDLLLHLLLEGKKNSGEANVEAKPITTSIQVAPLPTIETSTYIM